MYQLARKGDPVFLICFYGGMLARLLAGEFTTYYLLWISTFAARKGATPAEGEMSQAAAMALYQEVVTTGMILTLLLMPLAGYAGDRVPADIQIVFVFGLRMTATCAFFYLDNPQTLTAYIVPVMIATCTNLQNVVINALFTKKLLGNLRGALNGALASVASLGKACFAQITIKMIQGYGMHAPFGLIAFLDCVMVIATLLVSFSGAFDKEYKSEARREEIKRKQEEQERRLRDKELKAEIRAEK